MKFGLYARKSSEDSGKQVQSIENQIEVLKAKAEREGIKVCKIYQEAKSAKKPYKREQFNQMISDLQDGVIDGIVTWKLDRLSRNPIDGGMIQHLLLEETIKEIITYEKTYYPNDNSIMMSVELGMATEYSQALSKNVKRGQGFKVKKGSYPNKAPLGYLNTVDRVKGEKEVVPDSERFDLVRSLWDMLLGGEMSIPQILKEADVIGLRIPGTRKKPESKLSMSSLYKLFRNRFYYGEFQWSKEINEGTHRTMITKAEYDLAQEIIAGRNRPVKKRHSFPFTNLIKCGECGASITAEHKNKTRKDGTVNKRIYYRCTHKKTNVECHQIGIREEELEKQFLELLDSIEVCHEYFNWAVKWLHEQNEEATVKLESIRSQQKKRLDKLDQQLQKLVDMKLEDLIDTDTFRAKKDVLIGEKQQIEEHMRLDTVSQDYRMEKTIEVFDYCKEAKNLFEKGTIEEKKLVFRTIGSHFHLKDKKLSVELAGPFEVIREANKTGLTLDKRFATLKTQVESSLDVETCKLIEIGGGGGELPPSSKNKSYRTYYERSLLF